MRPPQKAQVFRNGGTGNWKSLRDAAGGLTSLPQQIEHGPAGRVGESAENGLRRICNRTVTHDV
jgi:hypothetical protein